MISFCQALVTTGLSRTPEWRSTGRRRRKGHVMSQQQRFCFVLFCLPCASLCACGGMTTAGTTFPPSNLSSAGAVALGGREGRDRASIEATVAVATLSYGSSGSVCAHACVLCVLSCVWLGNRVENSSLCRHSRRRAREECL